MTVMSPKRLVMQRCWGLPLTLLKRIGQPPSSCCWMPVISRLGSTSLSVTILSPSFFIHSIARLRSLTSSGAAPSRFAFAIAFLQIIYLVVGCDRYFRAKKLSDQQTIKFKLIENNLQGERIFRFRMPGQNLRLYDIPIKVNEHADGRPCSARQTLRCQPSPSRVANRRSRGSGPFTVRERLASTC